MTLTGTAARFFLRCCVMHPWSSRLRKTKYLMDTYIEKKKTTKRDVYNVLVSCTYTHDYYDFLNVFHAANATIDCVEKDVSDNNDAAILFFDRTELSIKYAVYSCYYYQ